MAAAKPLPQLPSSVLIPRLTIEASEHLNNLVVHAVQQRGLHASWVLPIQTVLESLATWMSQGEWLKGIYTERRRKYVKEREAVATESRSLPKRSESKQSVASQSTVMVELPGTNDSDIPIRRLFELISKAGTEAAGRHLLLTIAAPTYPLETDSPLGATPADPACTFHEGAFYLPYFKDTEGVEHGWGGTILCGLDSMSNLFGSLLRLLTPPMQVYPITPILLWLEVPSLCEVYSLQPCSMHLSRFSALAHLPSYLSAWNLSYSVTPASSSDIQLCSPWLRNQLQCPSSQ